MKNYAVTLRPDAPIRKESDHANHYPRNRYWIFDANTTSIYLSPPGIAPGSYRTEPSMHGIALLKVAFSHTRHCCLYNITAHMLTFRENYTFNIYCWLQRFKLVMQSLAQVPCSGNTVKSPLSRLSLHGTTYSCGDMRAPLTSSKDEFHYNAHRLCSPYCHDHANYNS